MISPVSRTGCLLYFVNSRLARDLVNYLQCLIFVRRYQHIVDAVVVAHDLQGNTKFVLELTTPLLREKLSLGHLNITL